MPLQKNITDCTVNNVLILLSPEQQICMACGLCCDGTLFSDAALQPGEQEYLPEKMAQLCFTTEKGAFFELPCPYFKKKCTIYYKPKAHVCSSYRCRLLTDLEKQEITPAEAHKIIGNVRIHLEEIYSLAQHVLNYSENVSLNGIQKQLKYVKRGETESPELKLLVARCSILEALLTRHFKTDSEFAAMKAPAASYSPGI